MMNNRIKRDWSLPVTLYLCWLSSHFKRAINRVGVEKRKHPRCTLSIRVTRTDTGSFSFYHALNISTGGIFIKSLEPPPVGTELNLRFLLFPDQPEIEVHGVVAWIRNQALDYPPVPGMGIRFTRVSPEAHKMIGTFVSLCL